jgi:hypothetical protein
MLCGPHYSHLHTESGVTILFNIVNNVGRTTLFNPVNQAHNFYACR